MKSLFYFLLLASSTILISIGCKSNKKMEKENLDLIVHLEANQTKAYLMQNYKGYGIIDAKPISRSENKLRVDFLLSKKKKEALKQALSNDPMVINYKELDSKIEAPSNSTNSKMKKTSPIKKTNK